MLPETMYDSNFLDTLLTEEDFSFIKSLENDINKIHLKIDTQNKKRDIIVNLINDLQSELGKNKNNNKKGKKYKHNHNNSNKDFNYKNALLGKANNIFQLVNSNIKLLYSLETSLKNINDQIVDLLVSIDANDLNEYNKDKYITIIQNLKSSIDKFSNQLENTNKQIEEKDKQINNFFKENQKMINNYKKIEFVIDESANEIKLDNESISSSKEKSIADNLKEISSNISEFTNSDNNSSTSQNVVNNEEIKEEISTIINDNNVDNEKEDSSVNKESKESLFNEVEVQDIVNEEIEENNQNSDNLILIVSEKEKKVYLPYTVSEINAYLDQFADQYTSFNDVVEKEFIVSLDYYMKHPVLARFRETYSLIRDRESKSISEALKYAIDLMFKYDLNPTIVAACKTQEQLENYVDCLEHSKLGDFKHFKIEFKVNPLVV